MKEQYKKESPIISMLGMGGGGTGLALGGGAGASSPYFSDNSIYRFAPAYDTTNDKLVIAFRDSANSNYGTAVVGTVSDTGVTFGTPVVFESAATDQIAATFDANSGKVVIFYEDEGNSDYGTAIVGTVSGTSISFGSPVVFHNNNTTNIIAGYDPSNQKVLVAYRDDNSGNYSGKARVGAVSGTSISFGSEAQFESGRTSPDAMAFNVDQGKLVIVYNDNQNNFYGTAVVGSISGTSISFGSPVVFSSADVTSYMSVAYDANTQKMVVTYWDQPSGNKGKARVASVSGTSISFSGSSPVEFASSCQYTSATYNPDTQKVVVMYRDGSNSNYGTSKVGTVSGSNISFGSASVFNEANSSYIQSVYDPDNDKVIVVYSDSGSTPAGRGAVSLI